MPMICPGGFNTECACEGTEEQCPLAECECEGQISVNHDCTKAWSGVWSFYQYLTLLM